MMKFRLILIVCFLLECTALSSAQIRRKPVDTPLKQGRLAAADKVFNEAVDLKKRGTAESLRTALGKFDEATHLYRAIGKRQGEAAAFYERGSIYEKLADYEQAITVYQQALTLQRMLNNAGLESITLRSLGKCYMNVGKYAAALDNFSKSRMIKRRLRDTAGEAETMIDLAQLQVILGNKVEAARLCEEALHSKMVLYESSKNPTVAHNIGLIFYNISKSVSRDEGEQVLGDATRIYAFQNLTAAALAYFARALEDRERLRDKRGTAQTLTAVADIISEKYLNGEYFSHSELDLLEERHEGFGLWRWFHLGDGGLAAYSKALSLWKEVGDLGEQSYTLMNMAMVVTKSGAPEKALEFYVQALSLSRVAGNRRIEAITLGNLMEVWSSRNQSYLAVICGKQAVSIYQSLRFEIQSLDKTTQQHYLKSIENTYRQLAEILIAQGRLAEAQRVLGLLKEREYFEFVRRDPKAASLTSVRISFTPAEVELERRFSEVANRIADIGAQHTALLAIKDRTPEQEKQLSNLESELETVNQVFQKFLDQLEAELKKTKSGSADVEILRESQSLKDTLREYDAIALYTIVGQGKYHVILITPSFEKAYESKISETDLNTKIFAFRDILENPKADPLPSAKELYDILIGPELARDIAQTGKLTVLWSLDGALRYLPVAALNDGQKYLVESYRNVAITLASRDHLKDPVNPKWQVLGLGVSKGSVIKGSNGPLVFPPLAGAREELLGIVRDETGGVAQKGVLPGHVMMDADFTADAMKAALRLRGNEQPFKLVHIASHFNFEPGDETKSFLLLGGGQTLTLSQLKSMTQIFSQVELLTLSACNTATGGGGEGKEVEGFAVLAQRQGAEAIVATLWSVADTSTSQLMQQFYRFRDEHPGMSKAEALRQAQVGLLRPEVSNRSDNQSTLKANPNAPFAHPYYWAPFILIGNWK
jgi:CHAT domain-containing protein/tetratricopeptide (TPR) repeat protein